MSVLSGLEPYKVFYYFEEICGIPHGSGNTLAISNYLTAFAQKHQLEYIQDASNNVIIYKNGTPGYEQSPTVILQGHMDMVCEKDFDYSIDFETEGLTLQLNDGIITAKGTTLGGDDGIAVAIMLAILEATDIPHPPLEAVFTVDEEIGMLGAAALDYAPLSGRIMLNLDSEEEGYLLVSCAGGATASCKLPVTYESLPLEKESSNIPAHIHISGISGGHSGVEIDKQGANADKILGRLLYLLSNQYDFRLCHIEGGLKDNAIPKEANASILITQKILETENKCQNAESKSEKEASIKNSITALIADFNHVIRHEYSSTDPDITVSISFTTKHSKDSAAMTAADTAKVIAALLHLPNGVIKMSKELPGLVQTSLNLGILTTTCSDGSNSGLANQKQPMPNGKEGIVEYSFSVRSSVKSEKEALLQQLDSLMKLLGGTLSVSGIYPAWEYRKDSKLIKLMEDTFKDMYGKAPVIQAIHAGVECGLFCENLPGLDCVSYGPDIKDIHTSKEALDVESTRRTWEYTLEILKRLQ